jgi:hypothetical protein
LLLLFFPRRSRRYRIAAGLASISVFGFLVSCGSGGGSGGPGGGGAANQVSTSISLTTSGIKVPNTAPPTIQAKVSSSRTVTGTVTFYDAEFTALVSNVQPDGTATMPGFSPYPGTHVITASYSGDSNNLPSKTNSALSQVITGMIDTGVVGTTGGLNSGTTVPITIQ